MMMQLSALLVLALAALVRCQRPSFAGTKPIGYPVITTTEGLGDRFGEVDGTTQRLPIEANGDRDLIDRLSKLPIDKQPFWFINWQALEAHRQNPQTYPQKPNTFVDPPRTDNSGASNSGNTGNTNVGNLNTGSFGVPNSGSSSFNAQSAPVNRNPNLSNRKPVVDKRIGEPADSKSTSGNTAVSNPDMVVSGVNMDRFGGIELNTYV